MRRLLRHGSHLMLPDDHDVTDALSEDTWKAHRVFVEVAKRMFYEYQYQLIADIPPRDQNLPNIPLEQVRGLLVSWLPCCRRAPDSLRRRWCDDRPSVRRRVCTPS